MAYRIHVERNGNALVDQDYDDDGESAAGGRLLNMMELSGTNNVCVVVTRWFGGVQLGPGRFKDINKRVFLHREPLPQYAFWEGSERLVCDYSAARALLEAEGYISEKGGAKSHRKKKR